jgi:hypothetical protein
MLSSKHVYMQPAWCAPPGVGEGVATPLRQQARGARVAAQEHTAPQGAATASIDDYNGIRSKSFPVKLVSKHTPLDSCILLDQVASLRGFARPRVTAQWPLQSGLQTGPDQWVA